MTEERTLSYADIDYDGIHRTVPNPPIDFFLGSCPHCEFPIHIRADMMYNILGDSSRVGCRECEEMFDLMEIEMSRFTREYAIGIMNLDTQLAMIAD